MSGEAELDRMIAEVRAIGAVAADAAPVVAAEVETWLRGTASAGTTPTGTAWAPTKDGGRALKNAPAAINVVVIDEKTVQAQVTGHHVFHHYGTKKDPKRQIIPEEGMPPKLGLAVQQGIVKAWRRAR